MKQHSITAVFSRVKALLEQDAKYRDNDELLVARFWWNEVKSMGLNPEMSMQDFLMLYKNGRFTSADVITRARRKCNEEYPSTRGLAYHPRQKNQQLIKDQIKTLNNGMTP